MQARSTEDMLKKVKEPSPYDVPKFTLPPLTEVRTRAHSEKVCQTCCTTDTPDKGIMLSLRQQCCPRACLLASGHTSVVWYIGSCISAIGLRERACSQEEQRIAELEYMKLEAFYRAEWGLKPGETL